MKANNLMLGDLVEYNGYVCRVYSISLPFPRTEEKYSDKSIITLWRNGFISVTEDEIEPIPLTPEILELNKFKKIRTYEWRDNIFVEKWLYKSDDLDYWFELRNAIGYDGYTWNGCDMNYVHLLQHALRLCGLTELDDNFKI